MLKSFRSRIAVVLILANLPAMLVAVVAGLSAYGDARALEELAVRQAASGLASQAAEVLGVARSTLSTLALDPTLAAETDACRARLDAVRQATATHNGLFLFDGEGRLICSSGVVPETPERRIALFEAAGGRDARDTVVFLAETFGTASQRVVAAVSAVLADGRQAVLALALDRAAFDDLFSEALPLPRAGAILTAGGQVLALDPETKDTNWHPAEPFGPPADLEAFTARGGDNAVRYYASMPIHGTTAFVLMARPMLAVTAQDTRQLIATLGVPLAMIGFGILAVSIGLNRFVLRWIRRLREATVDYKAGRYDRRIEGLDTAPREIADLGHAFNAMVGAIAERSGALEGALGDKNRILRELHHRVKNNFQMVASLLALQKRELPRDLQPLLRVPEDRVLAMAAAHKASYALGDIGHVAVADLLREVILQVRQSFGPTAPAVRVTIAPGMEAVMFDLDRAVALALLVSELLRAALEQAVLTGSSLAAAVGQDDAGSSVVVRFEAPGAARSVPSGRVLPSRLIQGYLAQLNASVVNDAPDQVVVTVPKPPVEAFRD